jgi:NTE family protein
MMLVYRASVKIGIALSSGGAAGLAHVGVIEELIAAGIRIDCAAGTSAGAMVGAAWAADHLDGFRKTMCALTRRNVFSLFDPTWPRTGLLEGRRPLDLIRPYIGETIESLPHPFAVVATELSSGKEVVLRKGSVALAVRASAAVPGLLTPESVDGRVLADGGLVNPIPVDVARSLGADFVIAVSVLGVSDQIVPDEPEQVAQGLAAQWLAKLFPPEEPAGAEEAIQVPKDQSRAVDDLGLIEIMSRASRIVQARLAEERLRSNPPEALIRIPLTGISLFELHRSAEAIEAGRKAARLALPAILSSLEEASSFPGRVSRWLRPASS